MSINPLFNANYYLAHNADLIRAGLSTPDQLWNHYVQHGAQESILNGADKDAARAPNAWFQLDYYLQANPDLLLNGITAATALDHFLSFGISEDREFNPTLSLSDFDFVSYADENEDLRVALSISDDFTELTTEQKTVLMTHYLSYGYDENREGVSDEFKAILAAKNIINVATEGMVGTIVDDEFRVDGAVANGKLLDGLGGNDTVVFNSGMTGAAVADVKLRNIEEVIVNTTASVEFSSAQLLDRLVLNGDGLVMVNFDAKAVSGLDDALNVTTTGDSLFLFGGVVVNGIETVNLTTDASIFNFVMANKVNGANLTVNIDGGKAGDSTTVLIDSEGSAALETVTINAADALDNVTLIAWANLQLVRNIVMHGGTGDDVFVNAFGSDVQTNFTVVAGAGDDWINASTAIDTFTGGKGGDTFDFSDATLAAARVAKLSNGKAAIEAVDTITDFKVGVNTLVLGLGITEITVVNTTGITPAGTDLTALVGHAVILDAFTAGAKAAIFDFNGDAYVVLKAGVDSYNATGAQVIKLQGVGIDDFDLNATGNIAGANGNFTLLA